MAQDDPALLRVQRLRGCIASQLGLRVEERHLPLLGRMLEERAREVDVDAWLLSLNQAAGRADLHALADDLAVGEGHFFRHAEQFALLPRLIETEGSNALRVLSIGCGAGEEAYSLAMILHDLSPESRIEAFDISPKRLQQAATGRYGDWSMRATPGSQRRRWFSREEGFHVVSSEIRDQVRFEQRNVCEVDPTFWGEPRYDFVFCRQVLTHLESGAVERALSHIGHVLKPHGCLLLGRNESLRGRTDLFVPRESGGVTYFERTIGSANSPARSQSARLKPGPNPLWLRNGRDTVFELWRQGRPGQALHLADSLLIRDRSDSELLLAQVMLLMLAGRVPEAQRVGMRLLSQATTPAMGAAARFAKARGHELRGEPDRAEENYALAIKLDEGFALAHLRLGQLLHARGEEDLAATALRRASELMQFEDERRILLFAEGRRRAELATLCTEAALA